MRGGELDITYQIKSPSGNIVAEEPKITSVEKVIEVPETGVYEICFDNSFSLLTQKLVYFDLGVYSEEQDLFQGLDLSEDNTTLNEEHQGVVVSFHTLVFALYIQNNCPIECPRGKFMFVLGLKL